jgi:undecaprenyl-diphosphatase
MSTFHAFILGIVEGISEFLPISSTGHLILVSRLLGIPQTEFVKTFEIAIQLGAILSVVVLYWKRFLLNIEALKKICVAFLPTAVIGLVLYKIVKKYLLGNSDVVIWSLFLGGLFLIIFELLHREKKDSVSAIESISYKQAAIIGVFQAIAVIPGVSRSAATIIGGLILGLRRDTIVEFSFLLAVPTMLAATILDLYKSANAFTQSQFTMLGIGFVTSFVVAIFAIKFLISYIKKHSFIPFGIYRIITALLFLCCHR